MIKTIIFDIGNVLTEFNWQRFFRGFGYTDELVEKIGNATVRSPFWSEFDRGAMTDEEILAAFIRNDETIKTQIRQVFANVQGMLKKCDYAIPWIKQLKSKGYQVLVLSNFPEKATKECAEALDFLPFTDGGILSYQDKVIKPQPEIYQLLLERYHLVPKECVFLDDTLVNIEAAHAFGIHTIHFINQEQAILELIKLGVEH